MKQKYVKWSAIGLVVVIVASIGVYRSIGTGVADSTSGEGQTVRPAPTNPSVAPPTQDVNAPTQVTGAQNPGQGTP